MSHLITVDAQLKDAGLLRKTCELGHLPYTERENELRIELPNNYGGRGYVTVDLSTGAVRMDNDIRTAAERHLLQPYSRLAIEEQLALQGIQIADVQTIDGEICFEVEVASSV